MGASTPVAEDSEHEGLIRKAVNRFTFLERTQQLLVKPIRTVDKFENVEVKGGEVWHAGYAR